MTALTAMQVYRKLRALDVPHAKAQAAANAHGLVLVKTPAESKAIDKAARKMAVDAERRTFRAWCKQNGLPIPVPELAFATATHRRRWRWDWAWPDTPEGTTGGVALEIDGGGHVRGRHHRPKGFQADQEKRRVGVELGWRIVNVTPQTVFSESTLATLKKLLFPLTESPHV